MSLSAPARQRWTFAAIFVLALGLRVGFVLTRPNVVVWPDAQDHDAIARNLLHGHGFVETTGQRASRAPAYPLFLAVLYAVGLDSPREVHLVQALAGAAACLLIALFCRRLYGARAGTFAALFAAFYPFFIFYTGTLLTETFFILGLTGFMMLVTAIVQAAPGSARSLYLRAALAGALAGVLVLLRSSFLLYPFALLPLLALALRPIRRALIAWTLLIAAMAVVMSPWVIRNYAVFGHFIPTTLQAGPSLYEANSPHADGGPAMDRIEWVDERGGRPMDEYENNAFFMRAALDYMRANPGRVARLAVEKARRFWNPIPNYLPYRAPLHVLAAVGSYVPVMILGLLGLSRYREERWPIILLLSPVAYFAALHMVFVGSTRYRTPVMAFVIVLAGAGADLLLNRRREAPKAGRLSASRVRKIVLVLCGALLLTTFAGAGLWRRYMNEERIRRIARVHLRRMAGGEVLVEEARVSLLRGLILRNVRVEDASSPTGLPVARIGTLLVAPSWKELLKGRLVWRSLELDNLRLNAEFDENGRWPFLDRINLAAQASGPAPTVFVTEASVRVAGLQERAGLPTVEISRINATFRAANREASLYNVVVWSEDRMRGRPKITARFDPKTQRTTGQFTVFGLDLDRRIHDSLPDKVRALWDDLSPTGRASLDVSGEFTWDPHKSKPFEIAGRTALRVDGLRPRRFPYPLEGFRADADFRQFEVRIRSFQGRAGKAEFSGSGQGVFTPAGAVRGGVTVSAKGLALDDALREALPPEARRQWDAVAPGGTVDVLAFLRLKERTASPKVRAECILRNCSGALPRLPFSVSDINGILQLDAGRLTLRELHGRIGDSEFRTEDGFVSLDPSGPFRVGFTASNVAVNHSLDELIPRPIAPRLEWGAEFLGKDAVLKCRADVVARASRARRGDPAEVEADVVVREVSYAHPRLDEPVRAESVAVHVTRNELVVEKVNARWRDATLAVPRTRVALPPTAAQQVDLVLTDMEMDAVLHDLLPAECQAVWDAFEPSGKMSLTVAAHRKGRQDEPIHTTIHADFKEATATFQGFPYPVHDIAGRLTVEDMKFVRGTFQGLHGESAIGATLERKAFRGAPGTRLRIETRNTPLDHALRDALPPKYRSLWDTVKLEGTLNLELDCHWPTAGGPFMPCVWKANARFPRIRLDGAQKVSAHNARVIVREFERDKYGRSSFSGAFTAEETVIQDIALDDLAAAFQSDGDQLRVEGLVAKCYGGDVSGGVTVTGLRDPAVPVRYTGAANVTDADLAGVTKARMKEPVEGILTVSSTFRGEIAERSEFQSAGRMTVRDSRIGELPGLFAVLNLFRFHGLDAPAFHSVQLVYEMKDDAFRCHELNLLGDMLSLYGNGTVVQDGRIDFRFRPELGARREMPLITGLVDMIKDRTISISVKGTQEEPVWRLNPVLTIIEAVRALTRDLATPGGKAGPPRPTPEKP